MNPPLPATRAASLPIRWALLVVTLALVNIATTLASDPQALTGRPWVFLGACSVVVVWGSVGNLFLASRSGVTSSLLLVARLFETLLLFASTALLAWTLRNALGILTSGISSRHRYDFFNYAQLTDSAARAPLATAFASIATLLFASLRNAVPLARRDGLIFARFLRSHVEGSGAKQRRGYATPIATKPGDVIRPDIFISYCREDRALVDRLAADFVGQQLSVWYDRDIKAGSHFARYIDEMLAAAHCVVVLWTPHSVRSRWVYAEVSKADERGVLVPAIIGGALSIPVPFNTLHRHSLPDEHDKLLEDVRDRVAAARES